MKNKEIITTVFFIVASLFLYTIFNGDNIFQKTVISLVFFVALPILFNKFILKGTIDLFGLKIGDWRQGLLWSFYSLIAVGFIFFVISKYLGFFNHYAAPFFIVIDFGRFLLYEFAVVAVLIAVYEFYFRGFVMFVFESSFKYWAILIQTLIFVILVLSARDSVVFYMFLPYLIFTPFAGFIAYKSKSILYSGISQFLIVVFLDTIFIKMIK
ncbi:MAG: hypothetical protein US57_C0016G0023 [Candidatus Moranbacteria bacterium GW2011_GWC2_37_73]|nr:MAG: hypothetical protein UR95_C0002G0006 [Parcubacteria group bacterium GW2011_GWC1_36_108]KKQ00224.1 MAG: hypothetical protein US09_C0017G0011 [Candidatus Moranbacteria bacterium GW2011_GWD1_36_198]KKQ00333.1 MAG: hypothetical protein US10_C0034G0003 [Candidatus Moranbacteria bacterium GW2011_GWD2_36_198]KKQ39268.1 MAG: hypothetical protein US57_C0016G0023 [Candidatus Moranbacteria bacterium GW2011_GWC2_37_73]HAR99603.1 hypothetical protein [Candidatus Moranbacteria bacterium]